MSLKPVFQNIKNNLKNILLRRKVEKKVTEVFQLPVYEQTKQYAKFMDAKTKQESIASRTENLKLKAQLQEYKKREKERGEEEKIRKSLIKYQKKKRDWEKTKAIKLEIQGIKPLPTFFLKNNVSLGKLKGIYMQETEDGSLIYYPWLTAGGKEAKFLAPTQNIPDWFKSQLGIVSQMSAGKIDTNFDITGEGRPILNYVQTATDEKTGEKYQVISLEERDKREYEHTINGLLKRIGGLSQKIKDLERKETDYEIVLADAEIKTSGATKKAEIWASKFAALKDTNVEMTREVAEAVSAVQELKVDQVLTEQMLNKFKEIFERWKDYFADMAPKEQSEIERERVIDDIDKAVDITTQLRREPKTKKVEEVAGPKTE